MRQSSNSIRCTSARHSVGQSAHRSGGFTIVELLVVVGIITLLVGVLLVALRSAQTRSKENVTAATIQAFMNGAEVFNQEHGYYPGVVPENILVYNAETNGPTPITGTENALLHMMGGYMVRAESTPEQWNNFTSAPNATVYTFDTPDGGTWDLAVDRARIGEGPTVAGKKFEPYFTASDQDVRAIPGQLEEPEQVDALVALPDLVDAWDRPILYMRQLRKLGPIVASTSATNPLTAQFNPAPLAPYLDDETNAKSVLRDINGGSDRGRNNLARLLLHPSIADQARGAMVLISGGEDRIYFSETDGPGSPTDEIDDLNSPEASTIADIVSEYDDVVRFAGTS